MRMRMLILLTDPQSYCAALPQVPRSPDPGRRPPGIPGAPPPFPRDLEPRPASSRREGCVPIPLPGRNLPTYGFPRSISRTRMAARYWIVLGGLALAAGVTALLLTQPETAGGQAPALPQPALQALQEGRYLRATRLIRAALASVPDTTPATIVTLARAEAGWGDWQRARELLDGRPWLDRVENGAGLELLGRARLAEGDPVGAAKVLERYLDVARLDQRDRGITLVRIGQAYQSGADQPAAVRAYDEAARVLAPVAGWVRLAAAGAAADAGDTVQVRQRLASLPPDLARDRGWSLRVQAAVRARDTGAAVLMAERAAAALPGAAARAAAWQSAGDLLSRSGNRAAALQAFDAAVAAAPG